MDIKILRQAQKELRKAPKSIILDTFSLFEDLEKGNRLSMPISPFQVFQRASRTKTKL